MRMWSEILRTLKPLGLFANKKPSAIDKNLKKEGRGSFKEQAPFKALPIPQWKTLTHSPTIDLYFDQLREKIFEQIDILKEQIWKGQGGHIHHGTVFRESGRIEPGRKYFFVQQPGRKGWLFERSSSGWVVSLCEKIVGKELFLRDEEPIDIVQLQFIEETNQIRIINEHHSEEAEDLLRFAQYASKITHNLVQTFSDQMGFPIAMNSDRKFPIRPNR